MDELKHKFRDLINKHQNRNVKIPSMGFSDYYVHSISTPTPKAKNAETSSSTTTTAAKNFALEDSGNHESALIPDQEILDATDEIYFSENVDTGVYELNKFINEDRLDNESVMRAMLVLKQQQKVVSKKVLQHIMNQQNQCKDEVTQMSDTEQMLQQSLLECKKARSYLSCAKKNLTTTSLQILATYKKRETLHGLLETLYKLKKMKSTEIQLQKLLEIGDYSGAISLLLECKRLAAENDQYKCVESLSLKLQDVLLLTELQLDNVLNEMTQSFDVKKYSKLQEAYGLLGKTIFAMDQLHMNFISAIHTTAFTVLREHNEQNADDKQKMLFEQMCENVSADKYIPCLIQLCRSFWSILVGYYQVTLWHQNVNTPESKQILTNCEHTEYIQQKFKTGHARIWNDIQSKICTYLSSSTKLHTLKYEQFIQVLSIVQRLRKVGKEFSNEPSINLMECMKMQSIQFFQRYHTACLEEICLFLDNEAWMPVNSFSSLIQLQEFNSVKSSLQRFLLSDNNNKESNGNGTSGLRTSTPVTGHHRLSPSKTIAAAAHRKRSFDNLLDTNGEETSSLHSQEDGGSSVYGSCGYFLRFSEKSSPFDGGFDESMLEEDILAGIADESSCYFSEESEEERAGENVVLQPATNPLVNTAATSDNTNIMVNNSSLNVLRCIGRYLQMCKLLHSIAPQIVTSMTELIDFYTYAVHDFFGRDLPIPNDNLYMRLLVDNLNRIAETIVPKVKNWPSSGSMIQMELCNPDTMYGLMQRVVGVESAITLVQQFAQLRGYLEHILLCADRRPLNEYLEMTAAYITGLRKPVYMCVTARTIDLQMVLTTMGKVKWDVNSVNVQHSTYVDTVNRGLQTFAMRLEEIEKAIVKIPKESIWDSFAHVITHTLVEGYSNAKKCTAGGRALMQLDFAHFMSILELISNLKYPTHHVYVDGYIKAYYMPKDLLETWIIDEKQKNTYSAKQFTTLITCTCVNDKKTRQKLLALLEQQPQNLDSTF